MAVDKLAFQYETGRASNLAILIFSQNLSQIRTSGTTMTNVSSVADANFAAGRLSATEIVTSSATGTKKYQSSTWPALAAGYYVAQIYDVTTPADSSPGPTDAPIAGGSYDLHWDGTDLAIGVRTVSSSVTNESPAGNGADAVTITITIGVTPVADADVWITSDSSGLNAVAGTLQTDDAGQCTFLLDAGLTYYLSAQKAGMNAIVNRSFVAQAD